MATNSIRTIATPTAAPMTRFLRLSREAASVRKSSSPLAGIVPARMKPLREPGWYEKVKRDGKRSRGQTVYQLAKYERERKMADGQEGKKKNRCWRNDKDFQRARSKIFKSLYG